MLDIAQPTVFSLSIQQMEREVRLTENALAVLKRRYLRRGPDGQPAETVEQVFQRVAFHIAAVEEEWGDDVAAVAGIFYDLITSLRFLPNSPTFTGAGTPLAQLAACFVLPISDDMGREEDGIFQTLRDAALIQQTGGGTGFSFSRLRPRGAVVRSSGGRATGPVGFMQVFDVASGIVSQGGARRGANMAVLRVDHLDVREFIHCKSNENAITNFNISVGVTDAFMRAVEEDGTIDLVNSQDGKVWKTVRAREIFDEIITGAHRNGEPGVLFLDTANRDNPCPHLGEYEASNPCAEQFLLPYENCCLGSVNLARHVSHGDNGHPAVDWENLRETVELAVRFLDDVINANAYVPAVPQLKEAAHRTRRIGLGIMGLGDLLYHLRVRYGSEGAQELAAQVMEFIRYHAMRTSIELARKRGPFPAIRGSIYDPDDGSTELAEVLRWTVPRPLTPYARLEKWGRPPLDWEAVVEGIRRYGIHNAAQTTVAPTGTIATVSGCEAYGCEPVFALAYVRRVNDNGKDLELQYVSPLFLQALREAGLDDAARERIVQQVMVTGSCQNVEDVPPAVRAVFVVAGDITAEEHVRMQAALQAFVDSSISKTINFSATATPDDVARAFQLAWKLGCKGLTVYVTGSREKVVLETEATRRARKQARGTPMVLTTVRPRPHHLNGKTYRLGTPLGTAYITVNINGDGEPFEVFLNVGK
ncbi:MAG: adenosylcobalamin-dependent ribonucleoside-diphosphate reductase, partial [Anaerolineae bacterium]|nr:adenosylcobalamin-dependent ribonucleoside-diphosphate reductase [Anaerolineae bacterium]